MKSCLGQHDEPRERILSKISQIEKDKLCDFTDTENLKAERTSIKQMKQSKIGAGPYGPCSPHPHPLQYLILILSLKTLIFKYSSIGG